MSSVHLGGGLSARLRSLDDLDEQDVREQAEAPWLALDDAIQVRRAVARHRTTRQRRVGQAVVAAIWIVVVFVSTVYMMGGFD
jgi:hypothetical protein